MDFDVTYDQDEFARAAQTVDWGVLVSEWQGSAGVYVVAQSPEEAAALLRGAADAVEAEAEHA